MNGQSPSLIKPSNALQQLLRRAIYQAVSSGMKERELVKMAQRLLQEKQEGKPK